MACRWPYSRVRMRSAMVSLASADHLPRRYWNRPPTRLTATSSPASIQMCFAAYSAPPRALNQPAMKLGRFTGEAPLPFSVSVMASTAPAISSGVRNEVSTLTTMESMLPAYFAPLPFMNGANRRSMIAFSDAPLRVICMGEPSDSVDVSMRQRRKKGRTPACPARIYAHLSGRINPADAAGKANNGVGIVQQRHYSSPPV